MRKCSTCQHLKRAEIDRRLAAGEPGNQIARDYQINPSSLHRHRTNCLRLSSSNAIMKEAARGTAALACLPSKEELNSDYSDLCLRIDQIVKQALQEGSLKVAIAGLNSLRQTLDSRTRLAGYDRPIGTQVNLAVQNNVTLDVPTVAAQLIKEFDQEPKIKARIGQVLLAMDAGAIHAGALNEVGSNAVAADAAHPYAARTDDGRPSNGEMANEPAT